jgi:hypothetical protein
MPDGFTVTSSPVQVQNCPFSGVDLKVRNSVAQTLGKPWGLQSIAVAPKGHFAEVVTHHGPQFFGELPY